MQYVESGAIYIFIVKLFPISILFIGGVLYIFILAAKSCSGINILSRSKTFMLSIKDIENLPYLKSIYLGFSHIWDKSTGPKSFLST